MDLFSQFRLGDLELSNRVVMAPMTRSRALGAVPNELMRDYYGARASAGLIITEGVAPSPSGLGYARIPGLFSEPQIDGWRAVTGRVHGAGGKIFAQLMHVGRIGHPLNLPAGARLVAPSAVGAAGQMYTDAEGPRDFPVPEALDAAGLRATRDEFVQAARNAIRAGFDGVELHAANGYLLEQFLHPHTNRRDDLYGGSLERRARFVAEVAEASAEAIGAARVGVRLSPYNTFNDMPPHDEVEAQYVLLAARLRGLVYLHLVRSQHPDFERTAAAIRQAFGGPLVLNGGFDRASAEEALAAGHAALISFGRPFIANPDAVARMKQGLELRAPDLGTLYTPGPEGYTDYPTA